MNEIVLGSFFGDEGKGQTVHNLCKTHPREEIQKAWSNPYVDSSTLGVPYMWDGIGYYERWVEQVYNKLNNVT